MSHMPVVYMPLTAMLFIAVISSSIILIRNDHYAHVYTLWYVFWLSGLTSSIIIIFLDEKELINWASSDDKSFLSKIFFSWSEMSTDLVGEITLIGVLLFIIIVPQILSFVISGIFGCGFPPRYVVTVTKIAVLSLIKFFCIYAGLLLSATVFYIYDHHHTLNDIMGQLNDCLFMLSLSFMISGVYYKHDALAKYMPKLSEKKFLRNIYSYMIKFRDR